jgi:hypothetical protein
MPPGITPAKGTTMIPNPGPIYQIGRIVGWPLAEVVVAEFAVRPLIDSVVVLNDPVSVEVWGPRVIGP